MIDDKNSEIGKKLTDYDGRCEEQLLFPKEEWDSLIVWHPVSNIDEIYKDLPKAKEFHENYCRFWLKDKGR